MIRRFYECDVKNFNRPSELKILLINYVLNFKLENFENWKPKQEFFILIQRRRVSPSLLLPPPTDPDRE